MTIEKRIELFAQLGRELAVFDQPYQEELKGSRRKVQDLNALSVKLHPHNGWFTKENVRRALAAISHSLERSKLERWLSAYPELKKKRPVRTVGLVMAGNIPAVGFHDLLCVLITGNRAQVKLSSDDALLIPALCEVMVEIMPEVADYIQFTPRLDGMDMVIATGSDNTARYFEYYFGKYPHIIRKNRNSVAVLTAETSDEELSALGEDIFAYFGLGCRNVTKLYVHNDFNLDRFFGAIFDHQSVMEHNKYANNYDYYKAIYLLNKEELLENGFMILRPHASLSSPVATLHYERFAALEEVVRKVEAQKDQIQCLVSHPGVLAGSVPFGKAQSPEVWNYADHVDTVQFLLEN